jgi:hypothetical protein
MNLLSLGGLNRKREGRKIFVFEIPKIFSDLPFFPLPVPL